MSGFILTIADVCADVCTDVGAVGGAMDAIIFLSSAAVSVGDGCNSFCDLAFNNGEMVDFGVGMDVVLSCGVRDTGTMESDPSRVLV